MTTIDKVSQLLEEISDLKKSLSSNYLVNNYTTKTLLAFETLEESVAKIPDTVRHIQGVCEDLSAHLVGDYFQKNKFGKYSIDLITRCTEREMPYKKYVTYWFPRVMNHEVFKENLSSINFDQKRRTIEIKNKAEKFKYKRPIDVDGIPFNSCFAVRGVHELGFLGILPKEKWASVIDIMHSSKSVLLDALREKTIVHLKVDQMFKIKEHYIEWSESEDIDYEMPWTVPYDHWTYF